jgi:transcriptional regulator with XRE-family HTH domain
MSAEPNPQGSVEKTVSSNIKLLRRAYGMTVQGLSDRLYAMGRKVPASAVTKTEQGLRRITVDEFASLLMIFNVGAEKMLQPLEVNVAVVKVQVKKS